MDQSLVEILFFAAIAGFLLYRLSQVLGRRHGDEQQRPNRFEQPPERPQAPSREAEDGDDDNVVALPGRRPPPAPSAPPGSLAYELSAITSADPNFDDRGFVGGARIAFEMIVTAYTEGDLDTLKNLLGEDLYAAFAAAVEDRADQGHSLEKRVESLDQADITAARLEDRTAFVTVQFVSRQVEVVRDSEGDVIEGDPDTEEEVVDLWTFRRDLSSNDPTWFLVEAESGE